MNKAYILVHREPYEGDTIYGVYSTLEKAQEAELQVTSSCNADNYLEPIDKYLVLEVEMDQSPDWLCADVLASN